MVVRKGTGEGWGVTRPDCTEWGRTPDDPSAADGSRPAAIGDGRSEDRKGVEVTVGVRR